MSTTTLDQLRAGVEQKYGPVVIEGISGGTVTLLPAMRLTTEKRAVLMAAQKRANYDPDTAAGDYDEAVIVEAIHDIFKAAAQTPAEGNRLCKELGSDLAMLLAVVQLYGAGSQLGGSLGLAELIDSHPGALGYDLLHELHTRLPDLVADLCSDQPTTSPRWWLEVLAHLSDSGALAAALSGGRQFRGWGLDRHLRAALYDAVNTNTAATGNYKRPPKVRPWPRPEVASATDSPRPTRTVSLDEALPI